MVGVCLFIVWWPFTATECIFSFHFSSLESPSKTTGNRHSQTFRRGRILSRIPAPSLVLFSVGCCVVSANGSRLKLMPCPSLYFFVAPFTAPNDRKKSQQARARAPGANGGSDGLAAATIDLPRAGHHCLTGDRERRAATIRVHPPPRCPPAPSRLAAATPTMCRGESSPLAMKRSIRTASTSSGGGVHRHLLLYNSANQPTHRICSLRD